MFRLSFIFGCVCFILAGVGAWYTADFAVRQFENQTNSEVTRALNIAGHEWARVRPNGLEVELTGVAPTEIARFRAIEVTATIVDTNRIKDSVFIVPPSNLEPPRFSLEVLRNEDRISLIGLIPERTGQDQIVQRLQDISTEMQVTDMLETADHELPENWAAALDFGLANLQLLPRSKISIAADQVTVSAVTESVEEQQTVKTRLALTKPDGIDLYLDISAPRPVIAPFRFRLALGEEGAELLSCSADTELTRQKILRAVSALGVQGKLRCEIGLGVPTTDWADAIIRSLSALEELGGGSVAFSDSDITLISNDQAEVEQFEDSIGRLETELPELFSLNAILPPKLSDNLETGTVRPSVLSADLSLDGTVKITGRIDSSVSRESLFSVASALFGNGNVELDTLTDPDLPNDWSVRAMTGLKALSLLREGGVEVEPEKILISGRSDLEIITSEVDRVLASELGGRGNYEINVSYDTSLLPAPEFIDGDTCEDAISDILKENQFAFEPGAVTLTEESEKTLSLIALQLQECPDEQFQIQGHTDSQGPDDLNLEISHSRAETVLSGLLNRRVLINGMEAKGYGSAQPIADNGTEEGRAANRRIEFVLMDNLDEQQEEALANIEALEKAIAEAAAAAEENSETEEEEDNGQN